MTFFGPIWPNKTLKWSNNLNLPTLPHHFIKTLILVTLPPWVLTSAQLGLMPSTYITFSKGYSMALKSVICKVCEMIVRQHLVQFWTSNEIFIPKQFGFITRKSCLSQLLSSFHDWSSERNKGLTTIMSLFRSFKSLWFGATTGSSSSMSIYKTFF